MSNLGLGVMLGILCGNEETVNSIKKCLGKTIDVVMFDLHDNDKLLLRFTDNTILKLWDDGQSCCESRYMVVEDDERNSVEGSVLLDIEVVDAPNQESEYGDVHQVQFLNIKTSKGLLQVANHNEHNGYYGGFLIKAYLTEK